MICISRSFLSLISSDIFGSRTLSLGGWYNFWAKIINISNSTLCPSEWKRILFHKVTLTQVSVGRGGGDRKPA